MLAVAVGASPGPCPCTAWCEMPDKTLKEKIAKHQCRYMDEKYAYVNKRKHEIGTV